MYYGAPSVEHDNTNIYTIYHKTIAYSALRGIMMDYDGL